MTRAQLSMYVWTLHLSIAGVVLLCTPSDWFTWVGLKDPGNTMWVRLSGMLMGIMGYYFYAAARHNNLEFMRWGIQARMAPIFFLTTFVALQLEQPWIVAFGLLDIVTGLWTAWALKRDLLDGPPKVQVEPKVLPRKPLVSYRAGVATLLAVSTLLPLTPDVDAADDVQQIIQRATDQGARLGNLKLDATLTIIPKVGTAKEFQLVLMIRRDEATVRSHVRVTAPAAMANMQFVRNQLSSTSDELLLYVPATKQVQHVSASGQQRKFLNSDFTFGDLNASPQGLVHAKLVESTDSHWVVAAQPPVPQSIEWILFTIDKQDYAISRVSFYAPGHKMVKDLTVQTWKAYDDVRLPIRLEMRDLITQSKSVMELKNVQKQVAAELLPVHYFTAGHLLTH